MKLLDLVIPTNPEYDWTQIPEDQADYANPVELSNKLIEYANTSIQTTDYIIKKSELRVVAKLALRDVENELEAYRRFLLRTYPPSTPDKKTNLMLDSHVDRVAFDLDTGVTLKIAKTKVAEAEAALALLEGQIDRAKQVLFLLKDLTVNVQTHLAYRKYDQAQPRLPRRTVSA